MTNMGVEAGGPGGNGGSAGGQQFRRNEHRLSWLGGWRDLTRKGPLQRGDESSASLETLGGRLAKAPRHNLFDAWRQPGAVSPQPGRHLVHDLIGERGVGLLSEQSAAREHLVRDRRKS